MGFQRNGEAEVRREVFPLFAHGANHVTFGLGMLHVDHVVVGLMNFQPQRLAVKVRGNFHVAAGERPMGKALRDIAPSREALRRKRLIPVGGAHPSGSRFPNVLAQRVGVAFDLPAVCARLKKVDGIRAVTVRWLADLLQAVFLLRAMRYS